MLGNVSDSKISIKSPIQPGSNHAELKADTPFHPDTSQAQEPFSLQRPTANAKRIPNGTITGSIPLEAAKAYPINIWKGTGLQPRIAYADFNSHKEKNMLSVKLLPDGGKTAPHPQIVFFVNGPYHVEYLGYANSNPYAWTTWMELHLDARELNRLIEAVIKAQVTLENLRQ